MVAARRPAPGLAGLLAAEVAAHETSEGALEHRLRLARRLVAAAGGAEPLRAGLVVGSTALRRCGPGADLDIVLISDGIGNQPPFESFDVDGVHIEIERLAWSEALSLTEGDGWTWQLRSASRLGCGLPVFDAGGFASRIRDRAAAQRPDAQRWESTLRDVYLGLTALGDQAALRSEHGETLRGVFDNLALLTLLNRPRRYQKPKWALADLIHAEHAPRMEAMLESYGIQSDTAMATMAAIDRTKALIAGLYPALGLPTHAALLAMGHAPQFAEASYVSRALDDAEDLAASGRRIESQYVAKFAARLAAALASRSRSPHSLLHGLEALDASHASLYREVFVEAPVPRRRHLEDALAWADVLLDETASRSATDAARISA
jgi:hypothetical protein